MPRPPPGFRLLGPIRRALATRIEALDEILGAVGEHHGIGVVDLGQVPESYDRRAWAVARLHPSEFGHRLLARAIADQLAEGMIVHNEVRSSARVVAIPAACGPTGATRRAPGA